MDDFIIEIDYGDIFIALIIFNINELILYELYKHHSVVLLIYNLLLLLFAYLHYKYKHNKKKK
jgi:hypothetical protein